MGAYILGEQHVLFSMRQLIPFTETTEVLLVLAVQLLAVDAIGCTYRNDALCGVIYLLLLKKPRTLC